VICLRLDQTDLQVRIRSLLYGFLVVFALSITAVPTEANSQAAAAATDPPSTQVCFQRALSTFVELLHLHLDRNLP
jgi:hypothetical protein